MILTDACSLNFFLLFSSFIMFAVNELLKAAAGNSTFTPKKGSKSYGTVAVDECKIMGAESSPAVTVKPASPAAAETASAALDPSVVPVPVPVSGFASMNLAATPVPVPPPERPTFVDYVSGNCDLSMVRTTRLWIWHQLFVIK